PLFKQSYEKYAEAICIKRDDHEVWNNWGTALSDQARTKNGVEADALFKQSYEKYAEAVRIKPEMHKAWNNWGTALIFQAKTKASAEADALFNQACEKYREALHINPQYRSTQYNMACLSGLRGSADEAVYWLGLWFEGNPVANKADIRKDGDFDRVRDTEKFRTFLDGLN
ncbi:hypothetical protein JXQ70_00005, partial [bacterium]|nr:hypothetical protein [bacterium]